MSEAETPATVGKQACNCQTAGTPARAGTLSKLRKPAKAVMSEMVRTPTIHESLRNFGEKSINQKKRVKISHFLSDGFSQFDNFWTIVV
jgi:hypothetical protein